MPIIWKRADGSLIVTQLDQDYLIRERKPGETVDEAVLRLALVIQEKNPNLAGLSPKLVRTADMPATRANRHKWRLSLDETQVAVDPTVPDPPHPRQAALDALDAATTLAQLKAILRQVIERV